MVSVVIVNWNSGPLLEKCVSSLREHAPECDIIVVDNASEDGSLDFAGKTSAPLVLLRNDRNKGFAAACNQGWRQGKGDLILFLNPDAECLPGSVEALSGRIESEPEIWAAGGRLLDAGGATQTGFNVRAFPDIGSVAAEMLLLDELWPRNPWTRRYRMMDWNYDKGGDVDQPAAACLMVRRRALESLDGFDERFQPAWFEDVDLCKRIRDAGGRIVYEPGACFRHQGGVSLRKLTEKEFLNHFHTNQICYFFKHYGNTAATRVRRLVITGLYLRAFLAGLGLHRSSTSSAGAYRQVARQIRHSQKGGL